MAPNPWMPTPTWPDSLVQPEGALVTVNFNAIYNDGDDGDIWARIRDEGGETLVQQNFYAPRHVLINRSLQFTMPGRDLHLFAELGYDGATTDQHEEWMQVVTDGVPPSLPTPNILVGALPVLFVVGVVFFHEIQRLLG